MGRTCWVEPETAKEAFGQSTIIAHNAARKPIGQREPEECCRAISRAFRLRDVFADVA